MRSKQVVSTDWTVDGLVNQTRTVMKTDVSNLSRVCRPSSACGICLLTFCVGLVFLGFLVELSEDYLTSNSPFSLRRKAPQTITVSTVTISLDTDSPGLSQYLNLAHNDDVHPEPTQQEDKEKVELQSKSHPCKVKNDAVEVNSKDAPGAIILDPVQDPNRPPLKDLVDLNSQTVLQNVEFLLDFAIIAHPKTATSFLLYWLARHPEVKAYTREMSDLARNRTAGFVQKMYNLTSGGQYKRGYKSPTDIERPYVLDTLRAYWPQARIIIGLRHPVRWFESFYNYRIRLGKSMPPADRPVFFQQMPNCRNKTFGVCVKGSRFHHNLALLGKTNLSSAEERFLFVDENAVFDYNGEKSGGVTVLGAHAPVHRNLNQHKIFLYETTQMEDSGTPDDTTSSLLIGVDRAHQFRHDLSAFLNLRTPLQAWRSKEQIVSANRTHTLDICQDRYQALRQSLMKNARQASIWIRTYLMQSPDVVVSSREYFIQLVQNWMYDPCEPS